MAGMTMPAGGGVAASHYWNRVRKPGQLLIMPDFDLTGELSLKIKLRMLRPITEKVHSGNGPVSLVPFGPRLVCSLHSQLLQPLMLKIFLSQLLSN